MKTPEGDGLRWSMGTARLAVEPLPDFHVGLEVVLPERTVRITLGQEEALEVAMMLLGAASGRLAR